MQMDGSSSTLKPYALLCCIALSVLLSSCKDSSRPTTSTSTSTSTTSIPNQYLTATSKPVASPKSMGALPFPSFELNQSQSAAMEPGITLVQLLYNPDANQPWLASEYLQENISVLAALNNNGEVIWYRALDKRFIDVAVIDSEQGHLRLVDNAGSALEVDMSGKPVKAWVSDRSLDNEYYYKQNNIKQSGIETQSIAADVIHHNWQELDNGNHLLLGLEMRAIDSFPPYPHNPHDVMVDDNVPEIVQQQLTSRDVLVAQVIGDVIIEVDESGSLISQWSLHDVLDIQRLSYDSWSAFYSRFYPPSRSGFSKDWSHASSLVYDKQNDTIIASLRHQDVIIGINRSSGTLKWLLGDPTGWNKSWSDALLSHDRQSNDNQDDNKFEWPYHVQDIQLTPQGTLLVFDNGGYRAVPPNEPTNLDKAYSRIVEYRIDEETGSVEQLWQYTGDKPFFSFWQGSVQSLPVTNNILFSDGKRVVEVNRSGKVVFELTANSHSTKSHWVLTRAIRLANLPAAPSQNLDISEPVANQAVTESTPFSTRLPEVLPDWAKAVTKANFTGNWQLVIDTEQGEQVFELNLHDNNTADPQRVITGTLGNDSVYAYINHHQISFRVLNRQGANNQILNFRGLLQQDLSRILGRVVIGSGEGKGYSLVWRGQRQ